MHYVIIFDASSSGLRNYNFPAQGIIFIIVGVGLVIADRLRKVSVGGLFPRLATRFSWAFLIFSLIWTALASLSIFEDWAVSAATRAGHYNVVEGVVENFSPMPPTGHGLEHFDVNGIPFHYSTYEVTPGFNTTAVHGGPIHNGLHVKIGYIGNTIVKLGVAE